MSNKTVYFTQTPTNPMPAGSIDPMFQLACSPGNFPSGCMIDGYEYNNDNELAHITSYTSTINPIPFPLDVPLEVGTAKAVFKFTSSKTGEQLFPDLVYEWEVI